MARASDPGVDFERLYAAVARGDAVLPWDRGGPHPLVEAWFAEHAPDGAGRRAVVVGCGPGADAEIVAAHGFDVIAFDVSPTAVELARRRRPDAAVTFRVADLLTLPQDWLRRFDLVLESLTLQSMPPALHRDAARAVASLVAPGGTLLAVATARPEGEPPDGPPWPLARSEVEALAVDGVEAVRLEEVREPDLPPRWQAELRRPAAAASAG